MEVMAFTTIRRKTKGKRRNMKGRREDINEERSDGRRAEVQVLL